MIPSYVSVALPDNYRLTTCQRFIGDMPHPEDFPKALYISMAAELVLFTLGGAIIYWKVGMTLSVLDDV